MVRFIECMMQYLPCMNALMSAPCSRLTAARTDTVLCESARLSQKKSRTDCSVNTEILAVHIEVCEQLRYHTTISVWYNNQCTVACQVLALTILRRTVCYAGTALHEVYVE